MIYPQVLDFAANGYPVAVTCRVLALTTQDLVQRNFKANKLNQLWLTGITEHPTKEGKLYFCAIKDVFSKRIVGYCADSRMKATLAVKALRNAIILRSPKTTVVHSDRGSWFRSAAFRNILANNKL